MVDIWGKKIGGSVSSISKFAQLWKGFTTHKTRIKIWKSIWFIFADARGNCVMQISWVSLKISLDYFYRCRGAVTWFVGSLLYATFADLWQLCMTEFCCILNSGVVCIWLWMLLSFCCSRSNYMWLRWYCSKGLVNWRVYCWCFWIRRRVWCFGWYRFRLHKLVRMLAWIILIFSLHCFTNLFAISSLSLCRGICGHVLLGNKSFKARRNLLSLSLLVCKLGISGVAWCICEVCFVDKSACSCSSGPAADCSSHVHSFDISESSWLTCWLLWINFILDFSLKRYRLQAWRLQVADYYLNGRCRNELWFFYDFSKAAFLLSCCNGWPNLILQAWNPEFGWQLVFSCLFDWLGNWSLCAVDGFLGRNVGLKEVCCNWFVVWSLLSALGWVLVFINSFRHFSRVCFILFLPVVSL